MVGDSFATAVREPWSVVLGDQLLQGSDHGHFLGESELSGKGCAIADKGRSVWVLIGTDQEAMATIAFDGREIEVRHQRNTIIPRYLAAPNGNGTTNIAPLLRIGGLRTIRLGNRMFQITAPNQAAKMPDNC